MRYKAVVRSIINYAAPVWTNLCDTNYKNIQYTQNEALMIATGCQKMSIIGHLHVEAESKELLYAQYLARCLEQENVCHSYHHIRKRRMNETLLAPNDTAYKRWSCHSGLKLLCKLCRTSPPPAMGVRFTVFWACRSCGPAGWLALLLTKAGDVETNPGGDNFKQESLDL